MRYIHTLQSVAPVWPGSEVKKSELPYFFQTLVITHEKAVSCLFL